MTTSPTSNQTTETDDLKLSVGDRTMNKNDNELGPWIQLAESLYEFLNRRNTTIEYNFDHMEVMVPKTTGKEAAQAKWELNGILRLRTWER